MDRRRLGKHQFVELTKSYRRILVTA
jgi:hypothetical protein